MNKKLGLLLTSILPLSVCPNPVAHASMGGGGCGSTTTSTVPATTTSSEPSSANPTFWFSSHNFGGRNPCSRTYVIYWGPRDRSKWSSIYIAPGQSFNTDWNILDGGNTKFAGGIVDDPKPCPAPVANYEVRSSEPNDIWRVGCLQ
jgi:hypothetical protein